ncbi:MAG: DinB family protein [Planctomycetaceae bacterium]|nr:DinB family protein [Planctomycetaceae bacterium]
MNARDAIKSGIDTAQMCCSMYLQDMTDEELMQRPHPDCNHINWQLGHLIQSDHQMVSGVAPGKMPPLPEGFAEKYAKETAGSDDADAFLKKDELLQLASEQLTAALTALAEFSDEDLDTPSPEEMQTYAPTAGAAFNMLGSHWMMHSGQWVVVRRQLGRPPLF